MGRGWVGRTGPAPYAALYAAQFAFLGVQLPFFPGWLDARGFTPEAIGLLGGGALILRLFLAPPLAYRAEGARDPRTPLRLVAFGMALCAAGLLVPIPKGGVAALVVGLFFLFGLAVPLADASVLREDRAGRLDYSRTRGVGSFAFVVANLAGGVIVSATSDAAAVWWMASAGAAMLVFSLTLPKPPALPTGPRPNLAEAGRLFRSKSFLLMLGAVGLCQGSHAVYYNLTELHWSALGYSGTTIGLLWAIGVVVEVGVLAYGKAVLRRFDPALLIAVGCATAALRWPLMGLSPPLPALFALQCLHAGTFTAVFLGSVEFVGRAVPDRYRATAMTVVSTFGIGAVTGVAAVAAGQVFDRTAPLPAYAMMGAMGAVGVVLALMLRVRWEGGTVEALRR